MLKDKQFWNEIKDTINEEDSDYVVLDVFHMLKAYVLLTDDLDDLPVDASVFTDLYFKCDAVVQLLLGKNHQEYEDDITLIILGVREEGIPKTIVRLLEYLKEHEKPELNFCAMGILKGIEEVATEHVDLLSLRKAQQTVFALILLDA